MKRVLIFFFLFAQTICYSQKRLTLSDAVNIALKNSPGIQIAKNNVSISTLYNDYGIAGGLPSVILSGTGKE